MPLRDSFFPLQQHIQAERLISEITWSVWNLVWKPAHHHPQPFLGWIFTLHVSHWCTTLTCFVVLIFTFLLAHSPWYLIKLCGGVDEEYFSLPFSSFPIFPINFFSQNFSKSPPHFLLASASPFSSDFNPCIFPDCDSRVQLLWTQFYLEHAFCFP